jgi:antibiotic biosynthesis monooxygenase (ABM) superfamily enzyme
MAFVTWLGVWPSVFAVALLIGNRFFSGLLLWLNLGLQTMIVVAILTWAVMPALTRLLRFWLVG